MSRNSFFFPDTPSSEPTFGRANTHGSDDALSFEGNVIDETDLAWLFHTGSREVWLPKSQCIFTASTTAAGRATIDVPEWLAIERGLV